MTIVVGQDSNKTRKKLTVGKQSVDYYSIPAAEAAGLGDFSRLPAVLKVVLENMLRFEDGKTVDTDDIRAFGEWAKQGGKNPREIAYRPARVLMQDFTGVPAVVDLAAMRDGIVALGGDAKKINPLNPVDLVIDHSVMIDEFGNPRAFQVNVEREYERNMERYQFLKWGQGAFDNFRVVPPGTGICHQVNLEFLSRTVWSDKDQNGHTVAYPDTLVGTDSHTTMVNGAAVLGWGVGGIEAEAALLGQPISMLIPEVVGFELTGKMVEGTTGTDLVLRVVEMLRAKGVVGKFVEFYGTGLDHLPLADRATIGNMSPEYGATCGFFPIDNETLRYLRNTGRDEDIVALVEAYARENGMWRGKDYAPIYTDTLSLDMGTVVPAISGPKRPQDFIALDASAKTFAAYVKGQRGGEKASECDHKRWEHEGGNPVPVAIPGDEGHHRLVEVRLDPGRRLFFRGAADLTNQDYRFRLRVLLEQLQAVDITGADHRVAPDADAGRLPQSDLSQLVHRLVGQGTAAADHPDRALLVNECRHDPQLAFAGRDNSGTVGTDQAGPDILEVVVDVQHVAGGNTFRDAYHRLDAGIGGFVNRIRGKCRRHEDDRHIGFGGIYRFLNGIEDRHLALKLLASLARRHPGNHLGAVFQHLGGMEGALFTGDPLNHHPAFFINDNTHVSPLFSLFIFS